MKLLNLFKFKKKIGQNYLIFNIKNFFDLCSGLNFFNIFSNEIEYLKNCFCKNKIYLYNNIFLYNNILKFNFCKIKKININISFNIILFFIILFYKIKIFYFKIIIQKKFFFFFKKKGIILNIKNFKKKFFFPIPKIKIIKILFKKNFYIKKKIKFLFFKNQIKLEKVNYYFYRIIIKIKKNVFFNKI